jgi:hypothetical protein
MKTKREIVMAGWLRLFENVCSVFFFGGVGTLVNDVANNQTWFGG